MFSRLPEAAERKDIILDDDPGAGVIDNPRRHRCIVTSASPAPVHG